MAPEVLRPLLQGVSGGSSVLRRVWTAPLGPPRAKAEAVALGSPRQGDRRRRAGPRFRSCGLRALDAAGPSAADISGAVQNPRVGARLPDRAREHGEPDRAERPTGDPAKAAR